MQGVLVKSDSFSATESLGLAKTSGEEGSLLESLESTAESLLEILQKKMVSVQEKQHRIKQLVEQDYDSAAAARQHRAELPVYLHSRQETTGQERRQPALCDTTGREDIKFLTAKYTLLSATADSLGLSRAERKQRLGEEENQFISTKVQLEELKQSLATLGDQIAVREGNIESLKVNLREVDTKLETVSNALIKSTANKTGGVQSAKGRK